MSKRRYYDRYGYARVMGADGRLRGEHRVVVEEATGRKLAKSEHVHHKNHVKDDNRLENLEVLTVTEHIREHHAERRVEKVVTLSCPTCGARFEMMPGRVRYRRKKYVDIYCSRKCSAAAGRAAQLGDGYVRAEHGTVGAYFRCGPPRCDACKAAMREYKRARRARGLVD